MLPVSELSEIEVGPFVLALASDSWLSQNAAKYSLERLWAIIGGGAAYLGTARIALTAASVQDVEALMDARANSLPRVSVSTVLPPGSMLRIDMDELPAVFRKSDQAEIIETPGGANIRLNVDLASFTFLMLSRCEESRGATDERGRFTARGSVAWKQGFLDRPVVDEWALVLRTWLMHLDESWRPEPSSFRILLSHDVDVIQRFPSWRAVLTFAAGAIVRRGNFREAAGQIRNGARALADWRSDPYYHGLLRIMDASEKHGLHSAFYFKTSDKGPYDSGYVLSEEPALSILREVQARGHEIGFHPGYETLGRPDVLLKEKRRLEKVLGQSPAGGRQHNLRFRAPDTWRHWDQAGLVYDSTVGYAEQAGFRCGTCHPFPVYDFLADEPLRLVEVPLIVMENTLFSPRYQHLQPDAARDTILLLAERCRRVDGVFTLLWHNSSFEGGFAKWARIYEDVVRRLADLLIESRTDVHPASLRNQKVGQ